MTSSPLPTAADGAGQPESGNRIRRWLLILLGALLILSVSAANLTMVWWTEQQDETVLALTRAKSLVETTRAHRAQILLAQQVTSGDEAEQARRELAWQATLGQISRAGGASLAGPIRPEVVRLSSAFARLGEHIRAGDLAAAGATDRADLQVSLDRLTVMLDQRITERTRWENQVEIIAIVGCMVGMLSLVAIISLMFWRAQASKRAAALLQAEHTALTAREQHFRSLVQYASDVIIVVNADGTIQNVSPAIEHAWGLPAEPLFGKSAYDYLHPDELPTARGMVALALETPNVAHRNEFRVRHAREGMRDMEIIVTNLLDLPSINGIVLTCHDITERKKLEQQLTRLAFYDSLTLLPNRALFNDRLSQALPRADRQGRSVAVLFLDLDNFKLINDSLGHRAGDELLVTVASYLQRCVRAEDTVARLGGDEFTILMEQVDSVDNAVALADEIELMLKRPIQLDGHTIVPSASIGIALSTPGADKPEHLLRNADVALYDAKGRGKGGYRVFDPSMNTDALARLELEADLRRALDREELRLEYQPVVSLDSGKIREVEALVRWHHPDHGRIPPLDFIPLAEETGLIVPLGLWVLRESCRQVRAWQLAHPLDPPLVVGVNLSARQFQDPTLVEDIAAVLRDTGLPPETLKLEITESVIMVDTEATVSTLHELKALGLQLAVDDFGTGYSSLSYLKRFPVDTLKVDRGFVDGLGEDTHDSAIVQSVVALAKSLHLNVTAEGIETGNQLMQLRSIGCDQGQGYLLARPLPGDAVAALLGADNPFESLFAEEEEARAEAA